MKVTQKEKFIFVLEPENEVDQAMIDVWDKVANRQAIIESIEKKCDPDCQLLYSNLRIAVTFDPHSRPQLIARTGNELLCALRDLLRLTSAEAADQRRVLGNAPNPNP